MRQIINISLPENLVNIIKNEVKKGEFASVSEFIRHLVRLWNANQLAINIKKDRKEFAQGKGKILKSLKNLDP